MKQKTQLAGAHWFRRVGLAPAILWTLSGLIVFGILVWLLIGFAVIGSFTWDITSSGVTRADATRIVLTMVAGAAGAVALVVTYRKQSRVEDGAFLERLAAAAAQLGDSKAAVQFAGVYALAALADESDGTKRQQCIDVLCGYVRLPYDPELSGTPGMHSKTEKVTSLPRGVAKETTVTFNYFPTEREVRATIFRTIRDHLRDSAPVSWSECSFDFTGAWIDSCDLSGSTFSDHVSFSEAVFYGGADFSRASFAGERADFRGARFVGDVTFFRAVFTAVKVDFGGVRIAAGELSFAGAEFRSPRVSFIGLQLDAGALTFLKAKFLSGDVSFEDAGFSGGVAVFSALFVGGNVLFQQAKFSGAKVDFTDGTINVGRISFRDAEFSAGHVPFPGFAFAAGSADFRGAHFAGGEVNFLGASFVGCRVNFANPHDWQVPPIVPWAAGKALPAHVSPSVWPPVPKAPSRVQAQTSPEIESRFWEE